MALCTLPHFFIIFTFTRIYTCDYHTHTLIIPEGEVLSRIYMHILPKYGIANYSAVIGYGCGVLTFGE